MTLSISARLRARCVPRLDGTRLCISSMTIHFKSVSSGRNRFEANAKPSDSGVVIRICGGLRSIRSRSLCGVSPVRRPTMMSLPRFGM